MRYLFLLLSFTAFTSFAGRGELVIRYRILKDTVDASLPAGSAKIIGQVYKEGGYDEEGHIIKQPVRNAKLSTLEHTSSTLSNADGTYQLMITDKDSVLYMYKYGLTEIVMSKIDFQSQHVYVIDFYPYDQPPGMLDITEKPVVYVYSDKEISGQIRVDAIGSLTFTYPKLDSVWNFEVSSNNELTVDGKPYPYLFWEAERPKLDVRWQGDVIPGKIVEKGQVMNFLESSLTSMGMNAREKTDFITYWAPRMLSYPSVFVQFTQDEAVAAEIGELSVRPHASAVNRVFMSFCSGEEMNIFPIEEQTFTPIKRTGFYLVEWGGTEIGGQDEN